MKKGKLVAPVVVTVFLVLWLGSWMALFLVANPLPMWFKLLGAVIPLGLLGVSVYVLVERVKEIRSGEEDDLSQY